jgi:hypothetical protein
MGWAHVPAVLIVYSACSEQAGFRGGWHSAAGNLPGFDGAAIWLKAWS